MPKTAITDPSKARRPRICLIVTVSFSIVFFRGQIRYLREQGFDVTLISSPGPQQELARQEGAEVVTISMNRGISLLGDLISLARLVFFLMRRRFDLVHAGTPKAGLLGTLAAFLTGHRTVFTVHGRVYENATGKRRWLLKSLDRLACAVSEVVIPVSPGLRQAMLEEHICPEAKLRIIGNGSCNGIDLDFFSSARVAQAAAEIRRQNNWQEKDTVLLFMGRLTKDKGVRELWEAFQTLSQERPNLFLAVVGDQDAREPLPKGLIEEMRQHPKVRFFPRTDDPALWMASTDIFILPSYREGLGMTLLEASACGRPNIATDILGIRDAVRDGVTGLLVPPYQIEPLRQAILRLVDDKELRETLGRQGRQFVAECFDSQMFWRELAAFYTQFLNGNPRLTDLERRFQASRGVRVAVVCAVSYSMKLMLQPQMEALRKRGYQVCGICSHGPEVPFLRAEGFPIFPVAITRRLSPLTDLRSLLRMIRLFRQLRIDIVHTHTPKAMVLGQLAGALARVPVRFNTVHGFYYVNQKTASARWFFRMMALIACRLATCNFSQSREDRDVVVKDGLLPAERMILLGNGIDLSRFDPDRFPDSYRRSLRKDLGIPADAYVVGIVARMVREKGLMELFEAFAALRRNVPSAYLLHVGSIDRSRHEEVTPDTARKFGIAEACRFVGHSDAVERYMPAMDVFCLPSYREGYPRSVLEASAMGLPAVVTNVRGNREAVDNSVNGLVVPLGDVQALEVALEKLYRNPGMRCFMSRAARARAFSLFDEHRVFDILLETYGDYLQNCGFGGKSGASET